MRKESIENILFFDVETATAVPHFNNLSNRLKILWTKKAKSITRNNNLTEVECSQCYDDKAAIYAEFNKIICISVGYLDLSDEARVLKVKSFVNHNEKELLQEFKSLLNKHYNNTDKNFLCGHNIKEFDCPVICRRMLIHGIEHPKLLKLSRKKPWHLLHLLDTLDMWKFGDYKSYISLDLLAAILEIPSPKEDIDGSMVSNVYWKDNDLNRIRIYCEEDVVTTAKVFLKLILEDTFDRVKYVFT